MTTATQTAQTVNPIEAAVLPLKADAVTRAEQEARQMAAQAAKELEAAGFDFNKVAPMPNGSMRRAEYLQMKAERSFFSSLTKPREGTRYYGMRDEAFLVDICPERVERFVANAKEDAAVEFDMFVAKLVQKVGTCDSATLEGNFVWFNSTLTVVKPNETERWKTRMIVNRSCLGKLFNQFPTRKAN